MSETSASLRRQINSASDLRSVVRTMRALTASSIGQYEQSARSLDEYYRTVELGLGACFRDKGSLPLMARNSNTKTPRAIAVVVFGSDQGLVGQFNEIVVDFAAKEIATFPIQPDIWAVGESVHASLVGAGLGPRGLFAVPGSVGAITPLIGQILVESEAQHPRAEGDELHLFYNRPKSGAAYEPVHQRLLPLDESWRRGLAQRPWPTPLRPEIMGDHTAVLRTLVRGYLFVSLFRACAESLASENASRLAAMQRADKNIDELLADLNNTFHRSRQESIDEELFDVLSGFVALSPRK